MRSEEEVLAGVIRVRVGASERSVPTLKIRQAREWKALVAAKLGANLDDFDLTGTASLAALGNVASDLMLELVMAYDRTNALGDRDALEDQADDAQLYAILRTFLDVSFPFVHDLLAAMAQLRAAGTLVAPASNGRAAPPVGAS